MRCHSGAMNYLSCFTTTMECIIMKGIPCWFKEIPWYEWYYAINEFWDCYALPRIIRQKNHWKEVDCYYKWWMLKRDYWWWKKAKYWSYRLSISWKDRKLQSHRLVAATFLWLDLNDTKSHVCHIDDNPSNCCLDNLLIWNHKINMQLAVKNWVHHCCSERNDKQLKKMSASNTKIKKDEYNNIIEMKKSWLNSKEIAEIYSVDISTITKIFRSLWIKRKCKKQL